jgi:hypothetical protein
MNPYWDGPKPEPPLELDESKMPPKKPADPPPRLEEPRSPLEVRRKLKKVLVALLVLAALAVGAAALALFTDVGRGLLPEPMKTPAAKTALEIEQRAREAAGPTFYTFTDDDGVVQIVDDLDKVPEKYRKKAKISH